MYVECHAQQVSKIKQNISLSSLCLARFPFFLPPLMPVQYWRIWPRIKLEALIKQTQHVKFDTSFYFLLQMIHPFFKNHLKTFNMEKKRGFSIGVDAQSNLANLLRCLDLFRREVKRSLKLVCCHGLHSPEPIIYVGLSNGRLDYIKQAKEIHVKRTHSDYFAKFKVGFSARLDRCID